MPKINICFVWHMHQPFYKNLVTGEYKLPWVRLHALKDYGGMVRILDEFPSIHQTFNLVPSLIAQIDDYAAGRADDQFLRIAMKPAEELSRKEKELAIQYFFQANETHVIRRNIRYAELFEVAHAYHDRPELAVSFFDVPMMRDLQVLSQLAWFDEDYRKTDPELAALFGKTRYYTREDQQLLGRKQAEALQNLLPAYHAAAGRGQIEISTSPFYHPILPLLCDTNVAHETHAYIPLPAQFAYPGDAAEQLSRSRSFLQSHFGEAPPGLWPSEGCVSAQTLELAIEAGFDWIATDDRILARSLGEPLTPSLTAKPFVYRQNGRQIKVIFRDHQLSDLIGFVYSRMDPASAAEHFLSEIRSRYGDVLGSGEDALVPIILDGENAWEHYDQNGRPFLRELYGRIEADSRMVATTVSDALQTIGTRELESIVPGSWIDETFDMWIGAEEDNLAWDALLAARRTYDRVVKGQKQLAEPAKQMAWEELLIAEGSDWCWWFGPEHESANKAEFDALYRGHLANMYRLLGEPVPHQLLRPILKGGRVQLHKPPAALIQPIIDGQESSRQEWEQAGQYRLDPRAGGMHGRRSPFQEFRYATDGQNVYFGIHLQQVAAEESELEFQFRFRNTLDEQILLNLRRDQDGTLAAESELPNAAVAAALKTMLEVRVSLSALRSRHGDPLFVRVHLLKDGLLVASLPETGELELLASYGFAAYAG